MVEMRTHEIYFKRNDGDITGRKLLLRKKEDNSEVFLAVLAHKMLNGGTYVIGKEIPQMMDVEYTVDTLEPDKQAIGTTIISDETRYVVKIELSSGILHGVLELEMDNRHLAEKNRKKEDQYISLCIKTEYLDCGIIVQTADRTVIVCKKDGNSPVESQKSFFIDSKNSISEVEKYIGELLNQPGY
ncbi:MAG: hypothetical protein KAI53_01630 [Candidatus Aenigmarchaeota archaeon]|nr:hypothetical protein [Candidatus Aenigmarchaeota archaeon]